jgi:excisionase family DNA binding protein
MDNEADGKLAYSIAECAEKLGISVCLCRELVRQKRIPALRLGERRLIVPKAALEKMLTEAAAGQEQAKDEAQKGQK